MEIIAHTILYSTSEIANLFVANSYQRKGFGQRLLRFAAACMQREGISLIILHIYQIL